MSYRSASRSDVARPMPRDAPVIDRDGFGHAPQSTRSRMPAAQPSMRSTARTSGANDSGLPRDALRLLMRQLALSLAEQRRADPRAGARIPPPIHVVPLDERFAEQRLELPGAQVARGIEVRIDVDERVGALVQEPRRARQAVDVELRQRVPRHASAVEINLIDQLRAVSPQKLQLLEAGRTQVYRHVCRAEIGVALQPAGVLHPMVEQHRVAFGDRVVAKPAILEREVRLHVREVQRVAELVEKRHPVGLAAVRTQHEIDLVRARAPERRTRATVCPVGHPCRA